MLIMMEVAFNAHFTPFTRRNLQLAQYLFCRPPAHITLLQIESMNKFILSGCLLIGWLFSFTACTAPTPEKYFDVAILNTNMVVGFAGIGFQRELESPSAKMGKTKDEIVQMRRSEVVTGKLQFVEENLGKLKNMGQTADNKEILQASLALHEFILPVYKQEYARLAELYDGGAPKDRILAEAQAIQDKYYSKFEALYRSVINAGKQYAQKHAIKVNWAS